ncbi:MAG: YitT family protein, partial [Oscillospiraceae bacterium]|nr:YitT family protein [Oscillospiraceae bacterium]
MQQKLSVVREYLLLTLGTFLVASGVYFFKFPNSFNTGGVTGLAVILNAVVPGISSSAFASVINIAFLVLGFVALDKSFGIRTVYCSVLFSAMLSGMEWLFPMSGPLTDEKMLELFFAVILPSLGAAILFNMQSSTGGTDILAMILKRFTSVDIGTALLYVDVLIAASTLYFVGMEAGLYSVLGLVLKSVVVDSVIESLNRRKSFLVVTSRPDEVCGYITHTLHRSATCWQGSGPYPHQ